MNALTRTFSSVVLLTICFSLSSCYTQLGATDPDRSDRYRIPAEPATMSPAPTAEAAAPTWTGQARVGLGYENGNAVSEGDYIEYGDEAYVQGYYDEGEPLGEGYAGSYYDEVQVTRYRYEEDAYNNDYGDYDYYGGSYGYDRYYDPYYVAYAPYYYPRRWSWYQLYSPYHPAPSWAYGYDPYFDVRYRHGWSFNISIGSPYYYRSYYDPFYCDPFYSSYYYGYRPTYANYYHGYRNGYRDGYYNGGGYYGGGYYSDGYYNGVQRRGPRGSIRTALGGDASRRRALLAVTDQREDRVLLDSPLGIRSVRTVTNDARQHVLAQQNLRTSARPERADRTDRRVRDDERTRTERMTDRVTMPRTRELTTRAPSPSGAVAPRTTAREPGTTGAATRPQRRLGRPSRWSDRTTRATRDGATRDATTRGTRTESSRTPRTERTPPRQRVRRPFPDTRGSQTARRPSTRPETRRTYPNTRRDVTRSDDETRSGRSGQTSRPSRPAPPQRSRPAPPPRRDTARPAPPRRSSGSSARPSRSSRSSGSSARPSRSSGSSDRSSGRSSRGSRGNGGN